MNKTFVEKWEKTGLLEGIHEDGHDELALLFEEAYSYMLTLSEEYRRDYILISIFLPIIRRTYGIVGLFDLASVIRFLRNVITDRFAMQFDRDGCCNLDKEVEWCSILAEEICHKLGYEIKYNYSNFATIYFVIHRFG